MSFFSYFIFSLRLPGMKSVKSENEHASMECDMV